jgi:hypothetical protein
LAKRLGQRGHSANALVDLGFVALAEGDVDDGAERFRESLSICREERIRHTLVWAVEGLAAAAAERREPALATQLLAATERLRAELGFDEGYYPLGDEFRERTLASARLTLGEAEYAEAWAEGTALSDDDAADAATVAL